MQHDGMQGRPGDLPVGMGAQVGCARVRTLLDGRSRRHLHFYPERIDISGGGNAAFDAQTADPSLTTIDGGRGGIAVDVLASTGIVTLRNLSLSGAMLAA